MARQRVVARTGVKRHRDRGGVCLVRLVGRDMSGDSWVSKHVDWSLLDFVQHAIRVALDYLTGSQLLVQAAQSQVKGEVSNVRGVDGETVHVFQDDLVYVGVV